MSLRSCLRFVGFSFFGVLGVRAVESAAPPAKSEWRFGSGEWSDVAHWSAGLPNAWQSAQVRADGRVLLRHGSVTVGDLKIGLERGETAGVEVLSWSTAKTLSVIKMSDRITIQWCLLSESLNFAEHGYASIAGGNRVTWHHNLFAHHLSRVVRFQGMADVDFRNNVIYDWGHPRDMGSSIG